MAHTLRVYPEMTIVTHTLEGGITVTHTIKGNPGDGYTIDTMTRFPSGNYFRDPPVGAPFSNLIAAIRYARRNP